MTACSSGHKTATKRRIEWVVADCIAAVEKPPAPPATLERTPCPGDAGVDLCFDEDNAYDLNEWIRKLDDYAHHVWRQCAPGEPDTDPQPSKDASP